MPDTPFEFIDTRGSRHPELAHLEIGGVRSPQIDELELETLLRRFWPNAGFRVLREAISKTAPLVARAARRTSLFRDKTGLLRKSIRIQRRKTTYGVFTNIVAKAPHAHFVEFGTKDRYTKTGRAQAKGTRVYGLLRLVDRLGRRTSRTIRLSHKEDRPEDSLYRGKAPETAFLFRSATGALLNFQEGVVNYVRKQALEEFRKEAAKVSGTKKT